MTTASAGSDAKPAAMASTRLSRRMCRLQGVQKNMARRRKVALHGWRKNAQVLEEEKRRKSWFYKGSRRGLSACETFLGKHMKR